MRDSPRTDVQATTSRHVLDTLLLAALGAGVLFAGLGRYPLWDPDEARHAEVARQMLVHDRWLVPLLNGVAYYDKPAPFYWLVRAAYAVFGVTELAARLPPALATLATLVCVHRFAVPRFGRRAALLAGLIYLTAPEVVALGRFCNLDATLTAFVSAAILVLLAWLERPSGAPWLAYVAIGCGTLVKGPVAIVLPALVVALCAAARGRLGEIPRRAHPLAGALVIGAIALPWFVAAGLADPDYIRTFLIRHNLERYTAKDAVHAASVLYYLPVMVGGLLPWWLLLPAVALPRGVRPGGDGLRLRERDLLLWAAAVITFFSLGRGKLGSYVLPALPALALWLGSRLATIDTLGERRFRRQCLVGGALVWATMLASGPIVLWIYVSREYPALLPATQRALVLPVIAATIVLVTRRDVERREPLGVPLVLAGSSLVLWMFFYLAGAPVISEAASDARLARIIERLAPGAPLIGFRIEPASLAFYARRVVPRLDFDEEVAALADAGPLLIVTHKLQSADLRLIGIDLHTWAAGPRHSLYANLPKPVGSSHGGRGTTGPSSLACVERPLAPAIQTQRLDPGLAPAASGGVRP